MFSRTFVSVVVPMLWVAWMAVHVPSAMGAIPPLPENAQMHSAAPDKPILFAAWAGVGEADANSQNRTEKLFAEPQVRLMMQRFVRAVSKAMEKELGGQNPAMAKSITSLLTAGYYRPGMVYLTDFKVDPNRRGSFKADGAWVMHAGKSAAQMKRTFETLLAVLPMEKVAAAPIGPLVVLPTGDEGPVVRWGIQGEYVIWTMGDKEPKRLLAALAAPGQEPKWLADLKKQTSNISRRSLIVRADAAAFTKLVESLGDIERDFQEFHRFLVATGLSDIGVISGVSGLDKTGYAERLIIDSGNTKPRGLMRLLAGAPIAASQIRHVPRDAYYMTAFNLDPKQAFTDARAMLGKVSPNVLADFDRSIQQMEQAFNIKIKTDVLDHLGTTWTVFNNGDDNGVMQTGLTATVEVRNRAGIERAMQTLIASLRADLRRPVPENDDRFGWRRTIAQIRETTYRGHTIYYLNFIGGFGPQVPVAWVVTERTLAVGINPQAIRAHVDQVLNKDDDQSITADPIVMELLKADDLPSAITYTDTKRIVKAAYPMLHWFGMMVYPEIQREGVDVDALFLPNASVILKHLDRNVQTVTRIDDKIIVDARGSLPLSGSGSLLLPVLLFGGPAIIIADRRHEEVEAIRVIKQEAAVEAANEANKKENKKAAKEDVIEIKIVDPAIKR